AETYVSARRQRSAVLEVLDVRPQVLFQCPRLARLGVKLPVRFGDGRKFEERIGTALGIAAACRRRPDLAVDDDVRDVDAPGSEFAGHALRKRAQSELSDCEPRETGAATQRRCGAGEEQRAVPTLQHRSVRALLRNLQFAAPFGARPDTIASNTSNICDSLKGGAFASNRSRTIASAAPKRADDIASRFICLSKLPSACPRSMSCPMRLEKSKKPCERSTSPASPLT